MGLVDHNRHWALCPKVPHEPIQHQVVPETKVMKNHLHAYTSCRVSNSRFFSRETV